MTEVRSQMLGDLLASDLEEAKRLLSLSPEEAVNEFERMGYDFTIAELIEFGNELQNVAKIYNDGNELDEEVLTQISGGCSTCYKAGVIVGIVGIGILAAW